MAAFQANTFTSKSNVVDGMTQKLRFVVTWKIVADAEQSTVVIL
jgi:hypothetical protein